jgi:hypothetical protein
MSAPTRRKLTAIDDPLFAPPAPVRPGSPTAEHRRTAALYVDLPVEQWDALARAAFELRTHKRRIVSALIARHVDVTTDDGRRSLSELLEEHGRLCR